MAPKDNGPKAKFSQLVPYLLEHKAALWIAMALSVLGAAISLAQPLVVGQVITAVQSGADLGQYEGRYARYIDGQLNRWQCIL